MQTLWPKRTRDQCKTDELLLDTTQRSIFSLIFFWKLHFLLQWLFSLCPLNIFCAQVITLEVTGKGELKVGSPRIYQKVSCNVLTEGEKGEKQSHWWAFWQYPRPHNNRLINHRVWLIYCTCFHVLHMYVYVFAESIHLLSSINIGRKRPFLNSGLYSQWQSRLNAILYL